MNKFKKFLLLPFTLLDKLWRLDMSVYDRSSIIVLRALQSFLYASLLLGLLFAWYFYAAQIKIDAVIERVLDDNPIATQEELAVVQSLKLADTPRITPSGEFIGEKEYRGCSRVKLSYVYNFKESNVLEKTIRVYEGRGLDRNLAPIYKLTHIAKGVARYRLAGKVMVFEGVTGDRQLFSSEGEPLFSVSGGAVEIKGVDGELLSLLNDI